MRHDRQKEAREESDLWGFTIIIKEGTPLARWVRTEWEKLYDYLKSKCTRLTDVNGKFGRICVVSPTGEIEDRGRWIYYFGFPGVRIGARFLYIWGYQIIEEN